MAENWTPGPWTVMTHAKTAVEPMGGGMTVASCGQWSDSQRDPDEVAQEQEANATLIAAAPELYEALKQAWEEGTFYPRTAQNIRFSLAKARGEDQ